MRLIGGQTLTAGGFAETDVSTDGPLVARVGEPGGHGPVLDAGGLLVLPGMVDIHGDAFERQLHPRPGVDFDPEIALIDTDRQLVANGITTAYHGVTWSWEPGLRGRETAIGLKDALDRLSGRLAADTRYHLRHEIFNVAAEDEILSWIDAKAVGCLAFNDHMEGTVKARHRPDKVAKMRERTGLSEAAFWELVERVYDRKSEVAGSIERLARAAVAAGVPTLSHDDMSPEMRGWFHGLGVRIAEFPVNEETARAARETGDAIVFGAPNVVRGGSHTGCPSAEAMAGQGLCQVLASDYYYPAMLQAPFRLAANRTLPLEDAWDLVSGGPAHVLGLADRGRIAEGLRADLVLVDAGNARSAPTVVATIAAGRLVHLADGDRLRPF
ncbi:alpha-D-ribose 1-methylphosphonate 5-triphosphate diphosphatase [Chthonobacter albigriseus]|uniref:alpha-D-ribose 1-methylphosphonate 5-triphosphate diphosphatase n=1 Tax=Chthonobacter albigriseus TaxID=1683161 RepID=UPI0015EE89E6|nr:alpha-D-ribose 1-methylphosphonate 5-triphosphate diphosphatase [Chthonobacter albigriseus]